MMNLYDTTFRDVVIHYIKNPVLVFLVLVNIIVVAILIRVWLGALKKGCRNEQKRVG